MPLKYHEPGLVVDLGVGLWAWPLPMDFDGDGDYDLIVSCPDVPHRGLFLFENPDGNVKLPTFKAAVRIGDTRGNLMSSHVGGKAQVLAPLESYPDFGREGLGRAAKLPVEAQFPGKIRANQWKLADYDGDGATDLVIGVEDWSAYGWDNAYDRSGRWTNGPLHGHVVVARNAATDAQPRYAAPEQVLAEGKPIDTFGMPSPCLADFDGDGDLDLLCGEFTDRLTYFQNVGTRKSPRYAAGRFVMLDGEPLRFELCMIVVTSLDWDADGDEDLVVGAEDGRVLFVEHSGRTVDGLPRFAAPVYFRQQADDVKVYALATPSAADWDGDGDEDLICGDTAGFLNFLENTDGAATHRFAPPKRLEVDGRPIRVQAGENGSIQGPCERKWGYTVPQVADWDHDGRLDVVLNSIWGKIVWHRNVGTRTAPRLAPAENVEVEWKGEPPKPAWTWWTPEPKQLVTQWRTTPAVVDLDSDGLNDLVMLDPEGYLAFYRRAKRDGRLTLLPPERIFQTEDGRPLQLNAGVAGKSGRRKFVLVDWDNDGRRDLIVDSVPNLDLWKNVGEGREWKLRKIGPLAERKLCGHDCCPTVVDWNRDGRPELVVGAEDGRLYVLE